MDQKPQIQCLNTDLDLISDRSLDSLCHEMTSRGLFGHVTPGEDGKFYAMFEDFNDKEPEPNIIKLLDALDNLSITAANTLRECTKIEFNIGYDCGDEPRCFGQGISHESLRRIVKHGASLRVTIYPSISPDDPRIKDIDLTGQ